MSLCTYKKYKFTSLFLYHLGLSYTIGHFINSLSRASKGMKSWTKSHKRLYNKYKELEDSILCSIISVYNQALLLGIQVYGIVSQSQNYHQDELN